MARIVSIGSMSFLITVLDNLIIIFLNVILRKYGGAARGDQLITCAAVVQSFMTVVFCPAQGITTGCGMCFFPADVSGRPLCVFCRKHLGCCRSGVQYRILFRGGQSETEAGAAVTCRAAAFVKNNFVYT